MPMVLSIAATGNEKEPRLCSAQSKAGEQQVVTLKVCAPYRIVNFVFDYGHHSPWQKRAFFEASPSFDLIGRHTGRVFLNT